MSHFRLWQYPKLLQRCMGCERSSISSSFRAYVLLSSVR